MTTGRINQVAWEHRTAEADQGPGIDLCDQTTRHARGKMPHAHRTNRRFGAYRRCAFVDARPKRDARQLHKAEHRPRARRRAGGFAANLSGALARSTLPKPRIGRPPFKPNLSTGHASIANAARKRSTRRARDERSTCKPESASDAEAPPVPTVQPIDPCRQRCATRRQSNTDDRAAEQKLTFE